MTDARAVEVLQDLKAAVHDMPERLAAIERAIELLEREAALPLGPPGTALSNTFIPRTM